MNEFSPKKAPFYFQNESGLKQIFAKIKELTELNQHLAKYIEKSLAKHIEVANREGNRLIILASNGSVASQLYLQTADLLLKFKRDSILRNIDRIECKVRPKSVTKSPSRKMNLLTAETAEIVGKMADSMDDPKLKEVMKKIADHVE